MKYPPRNNVRLQRSHGFTLVEVAIAVGILAVALVALLGLMPGGMSTFRQAMDVSITGQIAQRIMHDMEQAEFNTLIDITNLPPDPTGVSYCLANFSFRAPTVNAPALRYFDDQGAELVPSNGTTLSNAQKVSLVYTANIRILPRANVPMKTDFGSAVAQVTIQIARNPSGRTIPFETGQPGDPNKPNRNLFLRTTGAPLYTYYSLIGNNQGK